MKKYIAIILSVILIASLIQYANADWIDYMYWRLDTREELGVCIYEPDEIIINAKKDYLIEHTILALGTWESKLNTYSNSTLYNMNVKIVNITDHTGKNIKDFTECNVHILFTDEKVVHSKVSDLTLGVSWNEGNIMGTEMSVIEVYPKTVKRFVIVEDGKNYTPDDIDKISIKTELWVPPSGVYSIVLHEFGHSIGLGHACNELYGHRIKSVMQPVFDPFTQVLNITDYDLAAVYFKYGENGWNSESEWLPLKYGNASPFFRGMVRCT